MDPLLPREGIAEKMIHHADRSFPKPWNGFGVRDFWERETRGERELGVVGMRELVKERE